MQDAVFCIPSTLVLSLTLTLKPYLKGFIDNHFKTTKKALNHSITMTVYSLSTVPKIQTSKFTTLISSAVPIQTVVIKYILMGWGVELLTPISTEGSGKPTTRPKTGYPVSGQKGKIDQQQRLCSSGNVQSETV